MRRRTSATRAPSNAVRFLRVVYFCLLNVVTGNSMQKANSPVASLLMELLGVVGIGGNTDVGMTCSPLSAVGISSNSW